MCLQNDLAWEIEMSNLYPSMNGGELKGTTEIKPNGQYGLLDFKNIHYTQKGIYFPHIKFYSTKNEYVVNVNCPPIKVIDENYTQPEQPHVATVTMTFDEHYYTIKGYETVFEAVLFMHLGYQYDHVVFDNFVTYPGTVLSHAHTKFSLKLLNIILYETSVIVACKHNSLLLSA